MLARLGIPAGRDAVARLRGHLDLLLRWNARMNLTAVRDPEEIIERHFGESLLLTKAIPLGCGLLYDVGAGAGFPSLPVKAVHPEIRLVLVDSSQKKAAFLKEVVRAWGIAGIRVEAARFEDLVRRTEVELADWVTARAVGDLEDLLDSARRALVPHGQVALFLGEHDAVQIAASAPSFAWKPLFHIPGTERRVILVGESRGA